MAPKIGERSAMMMLPMELARPSRKVVRVASAPSLQYCLSNSGKNADITVMANAEFAQSYSAQDMTFRRSSISRSGVVLNIARSRQATESCRQRSARQGGSCWRPALPHRLEGGAAVPDNFHDVCRPRLPVPMDRGRRPDLRL